MQGKKGQKRSKWATQKLIYEYEGMIPESIK